MASSPLLDHILGRLHADLAFLSSQSVISADDLHAIQARLPSPGSASTSNSTSSPVPTAKLDAGLAGLSLGGGGGPSEARGVPATARALWDYSQVQPDDLAFSKGDIITILEESTPEWWQGTIHGRTGIFPSNYVEKIESSLPAPVRAVPPPPPRHSTAGSSSGSNTGGTYPAPDQSWNGPGGSHNNTGGYATTPYNAPPAPYQQQQPPYQPYQQQYAPAPYAQYEQKHDFTQPPPPQDVAPAPAPAAGAPPPIPPKKKFGGGKLGGMMATSFAGGIGFGAGTAIASEAVHAIF